MLVRLSSESLLSFMLCHLSTDGDAILISNRSGGNDPAIVFDDVDVDHVAQKVAGLAFLNSGQVCDEEKEVVACAILDKLSDLCLFRSASR